MDPLIAALLKPAAYDHPVGQIQLLETHISWILLTGPFAYKLRKPVQLGFVDFSTAARRRQDCIEEVRLNRRLAPDLYLGVRDIHGPPDQARFHGPGAVIEAAVQMRQFDQAALLPLVLQRQGLDDSSIDALAQRLALFHDSAAVAPAGGAFGSAAMVISPALANLQVLEEYASKDELGSLRRWTETTAERLTPLFQQRLSAGQVREGHGDLHLGNMALLAGEIVVFDCLEFNASLRWIDPISDMAFLVMDLEQVAQPRLAARLLNGWLAWGGDYEGLHLWRWYLTYRALVRAKVTALRLIQLNPLDPPDTGPTLDLRDQLARYLALARQTCNPTAPLGAQPQGAQPQGSEPQGSEPQDAMTEGTMPQALLLCHGVSASGKSHLARQICDRAGWIHLRSDVERRRLFGRWGVPGGPRWSGEPGADPYGPAVTQYLYEQRLPACVEAILVAGYSTVVDATFLKSSQRAVMVALAKRCGIPLVILACRVSPSLARRRLAERQRQGGDASEANASVLDHQLRHQQPFSEEEWPHVLNVDRTNPIDFDCFWSELKILLANANANLQPPL
ncbi:MAG: AAA family ATPase [Cyanobacteria bacterium]|nr:AAA family ATPase [Cyanobacteriota bacterium]